MNNEPLINDRLALLEEEVLELRAEVSHLKRKARIPVYLTSEEVSEMYRIDIGTLKNWVSANKIPSQKINGCRLFLLSDLMEWGKGDGKLRLAKSTSQN